MENALVTKKTQDLELMASSVSVIQVFVQAQAEWNVLDMEVAIVRAPSAPVMKDGKAKIALVAASM